MSTQTQEATQSTLSSYLNDHLAGSKAGIELAESCRAANEGTALGQLLDRLAAEIETDRATLMELMTRLDIEPSALKQAVGWMAERVSRLRLNERITRSPATSRLMELETLSLGIEGKRVLWKALQEVAKGEPRLQGVDFDSLIARAEAQRRDIEPFRLEAAAAGLTAE